MPMGQGRRLLTDDSVVAVGYYGSYSAAGFIATRWSRGWPCASPQAITVSPGGPLVSTGNFWNTATLVTCVGSFGQNSASNRRPSAWRIDEGHTEYIRGDSPKGGRRGEGRRLLAEFCPRLPTQVTRHGRTRRDDHRHSIRHLGRRRRGDRLSALNERRPLREWNRHRRRPAARSADLRHHASTRSIPGRSRRIRGRGLR